MHGEGVAVMQSSRPYILRHITKRAPETSEFLNRLGTWALTLALAVGCIIVLRWLTEIAAGVDFW
jgi:hypothetical protein